MNNIEEFLKTIKQEHEALQRDHQDLLLAHEEIKLKCQEAMDFAQIMKQKYLESLDHSASLQAIVDRLSHSFYAVLNLLKAGGKFNLDSSPLPLQDIVFPSVPPISDSERASLTPHQREREPSKNTEKQERTAPSRNRARSKSGSPSRERPLTRSVTKERMKSSKHSRKESYQSQSDDIPSPRYQEENQGSHLIPQEEINEGYVNNPSSHPFSEGVSQSILSQMLENRKRKLEQDTINRSQKEEDLPLPQLKKSGHKLRGELSQEGENLEDLNQEAHQQRAPSDDFSEFELAPRTEEDQSEAQERIQKPKGEKQQSLKNSSDQSKVVNSIASSFGITSLLKGVKNDIIQRQENEDMVQRIEETVARADKAQKEKINFFQQDSLEEQKRQLMKIKEQPEKKRKGNSKKPKSRKESPGSGEQKKKEEKKKRETKKKTKDVKKYAELMPMPYMDESEEMEVKNPAVVRRKYKAAQCAECDQLKAKFSYLSKHDLQKMCGKH